MKRLLSLLMAVAVFALFQSSARADPIAVWGFPLGGTAEQLRATAGAPTKVQELRVPPPRDSTPRPPVGEIWEYDRDDMRYSILVSGGKTQAITATGPFSRSEVIVPKNPLADPMGVKIGDPVGDALVKIGMVKAVDPNSTAMIGLAEITIRRDGVAYMFKAFNGRITWENAALLMPRF